MGKDVLPIRVLSLDLGLLTLIAPLILVCMREPRNGMVVRVDKQVIKYETAARICLTLASIFLFCSTYYLAWR